ncbi:MarR family transcriptional regulator [Micromonospora terminaliae]|uniref:MarR family transcriptional regulator n=1 Tax=Micromonospora terminaliae TaxID=1914461 RepID=A0AAJ3DLF7_9ACTN|nr:MarR family winged helix-turn-helix transcriptional regulator [Micromonospora terminaliae]NES28100.1 MarR family transcriptional regulator [Micromonospora terminaliae]QGL47152.1 MarR family transcriptional regulator [Micromonospora terminaliae]
MESLSLTPATQAVLDALTELGRGNVHELAAKSGKARSTTDKAIKTLADAGVIVAVDTDADPADGTPTQWTLAHRAEDPDAAPDDVDLGDEHAAIVDEADFGDPDVDDAAAEPDTGDTGDTERTDQPGDGEGGTIPDDAGADTEDEAGQTEDGDEDDSTGGDESPTVTVVQAARPGDRKVMAIKGVLADYGDDGATLDVIVAESGIGHPTATRLLTAMEQADAARRLPGAPQRWIPGPTKASDVDPNPEPPRCPLCHQVIRRLGNTPSATAAVLPLIRPDGTLHVVGPDGETHVVTLPTRTTPRPTGVFRSEGRRGDGTLNTDGSQPFGRGELEKLTLDVLAANPGRAMTPQDIATALGGQLGRTVSSGAVRNNCTKAAAAGRILLVSDTPLTFAHPAPTDNGDTAEQS